MTRFAPCNLGVGGGAGLPPHPHPPPPPPPQRYCFLFVFGFLPASTTPHHAHCGVVCSQAGPQLCGEGGEPTCVRMVRAQESQTSARAIKILDRQIIFVDRAQMLLIGARSEASDPAHGANLADVASCPSERLSQGTRAPSYLGNPQLIRSASVLFSAESCESAPPPPR